MSRPICQCGEELTFGHVCPYRPRRPSTEQSLPTGDDLDRALPALYQNPTFAGVPVQAPELLGIPTADEDGLELEGAASFSDDEWETIVHGSRQHRPRPV